MSVGETRDDVNIDPQRYAANMKWPSTNSLSTVLNVVVNGSSGVRPTNSERNAGGMSTCEREW